MLNWLTILWGKMHQVRVNDSTLQMITQHVPVQYYNSLCTWAAKKGGTHASCTPMLDPPMSHHLRWVFSVGHKLYRYIAERGWYFISKGGMLYCNFLFLHIEIVFSLTTIFSPFIHCLQETPKNCAWRVFMGWHQLGICQRILIVKRIMK